jgi:hypothetical protein
MPRFTGDVGIGDVIVTREGPWYVQWPIRLGTAFLGLPSGCNHAIIVHHRDPATGHWIGIEGRPGGVGWVDITTRLSSPITNANNDQPKTEAQRYLVATAAERLLGIPYDWVAILADSLEAARLEEVYRHQWEFKEDGLPGHVVCSAFADWAYETVGLPNPGGNKQTRFTFPGHWDRFMTKKEWLGQMIIDTSQMKGE